MSADPLEHKVPRHVPGEQYEKAYDLANRRGKQVIELRQKLDAAEAALAESRGELAKLAKERDELQRLIWAEDEWEAWEENAHDLMSRTHDAACMAENPRVNLRPWLKLSSYDLSLMAASMAQQRSDDAERISAQTVEAPHEST